MFPRINTKIAAGILAMVAIGLAAGLGSVGYVSMVDGNLLLISALPFIFAMLTLLVIDKRKLILVILFLRASGDIVFESSKFGSGFGIGGLINALVILIALMFIMEQPRVINRRILSLWGSVLTVAFIAMTYAPEFKDAVRLFLSLSSYCAVFVIAFYVVKTESDFELCISTILASSLLPVFYGVVDFSLHGSVSNSEEGFRLQSTFSHPNIFAFFLVLNISLLFYRLKTCWAEISLPARSLAYGYFLLLLIMLALTKTRSAWFGCAVIFAMYGAVFERRYLVYLLIAPLAGLLFPSIRDRLLDLGSGNEYVQYAKLNSFAWRLLLWNSALKWMNPADSIMGYGLNAFKYYSPVFFPLAGNTHFGAHSTYMQWFFETGIVGILSSSWMYLRLFSTLKEGLRQHRLRTWITCTLVVEYLFFAFSDNMLDYLTFNWYFWFFIGSACALVMANKADGIKDRPASSVSPRSMSYAQ